MWEMTHLYYIYIKGSQSVQSKNGETALDAWIHGKREGFIGRSHLYQAWKFLVRKDPVEYEQEIINSSHHIWRVYEVPNPASFNPPNTLTVGITDVSR
jgi:hypothetical protein